MIIYYINKKSTLKGPFDILDAKRNHIIKIGDFCIQNTSEGLHLLLVVSDINRWSACKRVSSVIGANCSLEANTLLFCLDGIHTRRGDRISLEELLGIFDTDPVSSFIQAAIDILDYKQDWWDIGLFQKMITLDPVEISKQTPKKTIERKGTTDVPLFVSYLEKPQIELFLELQNNGLPLREIYQQIKKTYPEEFRSAMLSFLRDYPKCTIYNVC